MSSPSKKLRRSFLVCSSCGYYHTTKHCPEITGKRDKKWDAWDKAHGAAVWVRGGKCVNGQMLIPAK